VKLSETKLEVIDRLVCRDRTAVSSALLAVASIGSGEVMCGRGPRRGWRGGPKGEGARRHQLEQSGADRAAHQARTGQPGRYWPGCGEGSLMTLSKSESGATVEEVLRFEDLPLGSLASGRALVRWSDGTDGEALRWYADEMLVCEGDLIGKTRK
jgi:hypothetical protein